MAFKLLLGVPSALPLCPCASSGKSALFLVARVYACTSHAAHTSVVALQEDADSGDFKGKRQSSALLPRGLHFDTSALSKEQDDWALECASATRQLLQWQI
jgi:hypothetical protein